MKRDILTIKCVAQKNYGNENKPNSTASSVMELCVLASVLTTITLLLMTNSSINIYFLVVTVSKKCSSSVLYRLWYSCCFQVPHTKVLQFGGRARRNATDASEFNFKQVIT